MEPFSTNDVYYMKAVNTEENPSTDEKTYKKGVDDLLALKSNYQLSLRQNADLNEGQNALVLNNVTLGVGILLMMVMMYK
jgi:hypothetical protein